MARALSESDTIAWDDDDDDDDIFTFMEKLSDRMAERRRLRRLDDAAQAIVEASPEPNPIFAPNSPHSL